MMDDEIIEFASSFVEYIEAQYAGIAMSLNFRIPIPPKEIGKDVWFQVSSSNSVFKKHSNEDFNISSKSSIES